MYRSEINTLKECVKLVINTNCTVSCKLWSSGGMILTGYSGGTGRKPCPSATLTTTNLTQTNATEVSM